MTYNVKHLPYFKSIMYTVGFRKSRIISEGQNQDNGVESLVPRVSKIVIMDRSRR